MQIHVKIAGFLAGFCLSAASLQAGGMKAYYTRLDLGDDIAGKYADVVVQFDGQKQFVFSRESGYLPFLKTEKRKWFVDELSPWHGDGDAVRQDIQFLSPQGERPEDPIDLQALTLGGIRFWNSIKMDTLNLDWTKGVPKNSLSNANMELIHFKSDWKVFLIFPFGTVISPWGGPGNYSLFPAWNHWPEAQIRSDGRDALFTDRLTHSALAAADNSVFQGNRAIYGFTEKGVTSLLPLCLSWNYPPDLDNLQGGMSHGYDPDQRAYVMEAKDTRLAFHLIGSTICPIANPCFVIKNWIGREARATLTIDGVSLPSGSDFRQGVIIDTDGTPTLVVWIKKSAKAPMNIEIAETGDGR